MVADGAKISKIVISASRRTDIPAFYMPWFMERIDQGYVEVVNPFNRISRMVELEPDRVHTIVFWSKDFGPFLTGGYGETLRRKGYPLFFQFTLNGGPSTLEPRIPSLSVRLDQLRALCDHYSPQSVAWRFDPITFFEDSSGKIHNNMTDFKEIAQRAAQFGITECISSFMDPYVKVCRRMLKATGLRFIDPSIETKMNIILEIAKILEKKQIHLSLCCEKSLLSVLPKDSGITGASCIPNERLIELFGPGIPTQRDTGQRVKKGCGCKVSVDIGDYKKHPCFHGCLYCYANPCGPKSL